MSIEGCCTIDDGEAPAFYRRKQVKARKSHRCIECSDEIPSGNVYERVTGKWDGRLDTFATCLRCVHVRTIAFHGFVHGSVVEDFRECYEFDFTKGGLPDDFKPCWQEDVRRPRHAPAGGW